MIHVGSLKLAGIVLVIVVVVIYTNIDIFFVVIVILFLFFFLVELYILINLINVYSQVTF